MNELSELDLRPPETAANSQDSARIIDLTQYEGHEGHGNQVIDEASLELSVVMPCLNEAETLATCIAKAFAGMGALGVQGEVIIADNGSTDGSQAIAQALGARVVDVQARGYGSALMGGIAAACGRYVILGDADDSYDFTDLAPFLTKLREGYDLVMGNRFRGERIPGAMPPLHRYVGTPALTRIQRVIYRSPVGDLNCGMRGLRTSVVDGLDLRAPGMEFASEMIVKASLYRLRITEVPTTLSRDGRTREPHLRAWQDGWRHLRFLLIHSPRWLFLYPGVMLMLAGAALSSWLLAGTRTIGGITFGLPAFYLGALAVIVGYQAVVLSFLAQTFATSEGVLPPEERLTRFSVHVSLEGGLRLGFGLLALGLAGFAVLQAGSGPLAALTTDQLARLSALSLTTGALGAQTVFGSFFLGILLLRRS